MRSRGARFVCADVERATEWDLVAEEVMRPGGAAGQASQASVPTLMAGDPGCSVHQVEGANGGSVGWLTDTPDLLLAINPSWCSACSESWRGGCPDP